MTWSKTLYGLFKYRFESVYSLDIISNYHMDVNKKKQKGAYHYEQ